MSTAHVGTSATPRLRSIGEVLAELRPEFPELASSKLRFLESEGLVTPSRLPNGYRKYTEEHIGRLRIVLTLQRDQYLPLRVIKEKMAAFDAGEDIFGDQESPQTVDVRDDRELDVQEATEVQEPELRHRIAQMAALTFEPSNDAESYGREELLAQSGLSRAALGEIEEARLIAAQPSGRYDEDALIVATVIARLLARGLEVRHVKPTRLTVEREMGNIDMMVATQRKRRIAGDAGASGLADSQRDIAGGFLALHAALLRSALRSSS